MIYVLFATVIRLIELDVSGIRSRINRVSLNNRNASITLCKYKYIAPKGQPSSCYKGNLKRMCGIAMDVKERKINVFVSSTFRDMQTERDELVKRIFPQLRKLCEERGVIWGEVDLRWGITDEQKAEGKVLPICLAEIEHCRPYFICMLGERYG